MRLAIISLLAIASSFALAAEMLPIPADKAYCKTFDSYCYEWEFARDRSLRFIAHGDEDGGVWLFYRRLPSGQYKKLFAVYPAMIDESRKGDLFWGYARDIQDIVLAPGNERILIQVAFDHGYTYGADWKPPIGQKTVPFVLFKGTATQPDIKVREKFDLTSMTVDQVLRKSRANSSLYTDASRR